MAKAWLLCDRGELFPFLQPQGAWSVKAAWQWCLVVPLSPPPGSDGVPMDVFLATPSPDPSLS